MSGEDDDIVEAELIMPFVVCESKGGPFHDDSFCAGYHLGRIDAQMESGEIGPGGILTLRTPSVPQLDLIAMRHGLAIEVVEGGDDEWTTALVVRPS